LDVSYELRFEEAHRFVGKIWGVDAIVWIDNKNASLGSLLFMQINIDSYKFLLAGVFVDLPNTLIIPTFVGLHRQAKILNIEMFVAIKAYTKGSGC
jgi:hypothetical protein